MRRLIVVEKLEQRTHELENAIHTRDELLRILAHDLRNPVSTIATASAALENLPGTEHLRAIIQRATIRMNRLIQDLLDQAVIERAGGLPMHREAHPAQSLTEEVCEMTRIHAKSKVVRVQCEVDAHASVYADRDRLFQVLTNLIDNALKFTPPGGSICVRSEVRDDHVQFSVSDSGPGIPQPYWDKIFDPYFRAPGNSRPGSGLGLAIAKQIVVQHGGDIWVESAEGHGSTFTFTIPAKPLD
jgi:signal transduction histidine kinase